MKTLAILTAMLSASLLLGQGIPPAQPPAADRKEIVIAPPLGRSTAAIKAYLVAQANYESKLDDLDSFKQGTRGAVRSMLDAEGQAQLDRTIQAKEDSVKETRALLDQLGTELGIAYDRNNRKWYFASEEWAKAQWQWSEEELTGVKMHITETEETLRNLLKPAGDPSVLRGGGFQPPCQAATGLGGCNPPPRCGALPTSHRLS